MPTPDRLRLGTRTSRLATWQAEHVAAALRAAWPGLRVDLVPFVTEGDKTLDTPLPEIGGKGVFTAELEAALRERRLDLAVHSLKDLPTDDPEGITVGAIPERADPRDAWVSPSGLRLADLPTGGVVGTSSPRRGSQILRRRPDLTVRSIRGNVPTRVEKVRAGAYDAIVLACAGLSRLGMMDVATDVLAFDTMLPAPGQGALAVQTRADDPETARLIAVLDHGPTRRSVEAERHLLAALGGGCSAPVAAFAHEADGRLHLRARILAPGGSDAVEVEDSVSVSAPEPARLLGRAAAAAARAQGADALLA